MSKEKKGSSTVNYRISLVDDDTHVSLWSTKFTKMNAIIALVTALVVLFALAWCIIAFTPMKTLIPGYPDAKTKHEAIQNAIRIDSLENVILKWDLYAENLRRVVEGEEPLNPFRSKGEETSREGFPAAQGSRQRGQVRHILGHGQGAAYRRDAFLHPSQGGHFTGI